MKKTLILTIALATALSMGTANAEPVNLDTLPKTFLSESKLQDNYLKALRKRYLNMYNRKMQGRDYNNVYRQEESIKRSQKAANVVGQTKSILSREGELEKDKERVQEKTPYQVKAVNAKSIFLKRAMDYYVYGGNAGTESMEAGNINMRDHKVPTRRMLSAMYKDSMAETTLQTRELQKNMVGPEYEGLEKRPSNYRTGDFASNMISPFTSLKWME